jgi:site-specific recombinase XerD
MALDINQAKLQFTTHLTSKKRAAATIVAYAKDIDQMLQFVHNAGIETISGISQDHLDAFLKKMKSDNYTPKSISRKINSIKTFFRYLKTESLITDDPADKLEHPKFESKPPRILSKLEYRALRDTCRGDIRIYAIVELFLQTGVRIGELANLTLDDVKDSELFIKAQEGHAERIIPLNKAAKEAVSLYLKSRKEGGKSNALFITKTGKQLLIRNIRTAIDRYFRIAGIEGAKVNDLRHTFIAHHLMAGTSIQVLSKLVGHKRTSTTEKYLEIVKGQKLENIKLGEL